ncbi:MAG: FtsX-like permease family protein [Polaromonas sp.]|nr:FtsX-like permease family protein [Polaromonas sp.]
MSAEGSRQEAVPSPVWQLLRTFSWQELRRHGVRHSVAMLAVMLGVALAFSIHLINESALSEFGSAVRSVNGQADLTLRAAGGGLDESIYPMLVMHPDVRAVSPVIDLQTQVGGKPLRILGVDPLAARLLTPALVAQVSRDVIGNDRMTLFDSKVLYLNAQAQRTLELVPGTDITVQAGLQPVNLRVAGTVAATGEALAVMDIAGAQEVFGMLGHITRLDIKLKDGRQAQALLDSLHLPEGVLHDLPQDTASQASNMSRAYRVNLTVLALIALFVGAFLVFSTLSLSVSKRQRQFALLGVLGLSGRERLTLVLLESGAMGLVGAALGIGLGTALAALALSILGGDLGGQYFAGSAPALQWSGQAALLYGGLGLLAALWGGALPARMVQRLAPAQALKGASVADRSGKAMWMGPGLLLLGAGLTQLPAIDGVPVWAYVAVVCLMTGGIECVPGTVSLLLSGVMKLLPRSFLTRRAPLLLSLERVRHMRQSATVAIAGIVVSLGLSIALTVMVASFRGSITTWLDTLLPADLYVRTGSANNGSDALHLDQGMLDAVRRVPGVKQAMGVRVSKVNLRQGLSSVVLISRPVAASADDVQNKLPLIGPDLPTPVGQLGIYVSEIVVELYGAKPGSMLNLPLRAGQPPVAAFVRGVWRDYAHQQGAIVMADVDYQRLTGDKEVNDLALWLGADTHSSDVQSGIRQAAADKGLDGSMLIFKEPGEIRQSTMKIFDRSFAVTYWLQAVGIGIGLFGISASFSAQILARRKEFGLLSHLGFTREQMLRVLAGEGAALTAVGALMGLALGLAVSVILVYVVNPQSFHWTMDMLLPWPHLIMLCMGIVVAGAVTAWMSGRAAVGSDVVRAVKEDW